MNNTNSHVQSDDNKQVDAPLTTSLLSDMKRFPDLDIGVFDYVLKCVEGPFFNKLLYINTSEVGEVFGGSSDYDVVANPHKLTMFIENVDLSDLHAKIRYDE